MAKSGSSRGDDPALSGRSIRARRWLRAWGPAVAWAAFVFGMSALPGSALPPLPGPDMDKVAHAIVYGVLGMLCWRGTRLTQGLGPVRTVIMATAIASLYGITDEFHQTFTPSRTADWNDVVADAAGGFLGALACGVVSGSRARARARTRESRERDRDRDRKKGPQEGA